MDYMAYAYLQLPSDGDAQRVVDEAAQVTGSVRRGAAIPLRPKPTCSSSLPCEMTGATRGAEIRSAPRVASGVPLGPVPTSVGGR